jgi:hypothetical protein
MNPKASFGNRFRSKLRGIIPSAARDCSTYQFRYATLSELEFHNNSTLKYMMNTSQDSTDSYKYLGKSPHEFHQK